MLGLSFLLPFSAPSFHARVIKKNLLVAVDDPSAIQVVGTQLHGHAVTGKNAYVVLAHPSRDMGQHLVIVLELDLEHGVGQRLGDHRHYLNRIFLRQTVSRFGRPALALPACYPERATRSEFSLRLRSPPPCAQNERSCFRPRPPPSSRRPEPLPQPCRHSPSARWQSPFRPSTSFPCPAGQSSAPAGLRACVRRYRGPQSRAPQKIPRPRPPLVPRLRHRPGLPPAEPLQCPR